jgi:hypothetical protein
MQKKFAILTSAILGATRGKMVAHFHLSAPVRPAVTTSFMAD